MIKIDEGLVEWEGDTKQITAELYTLLDTVFMASAEASNKTESEIRELMIDGYYKWCAYKEEENAN